MKKIKYFIKTTVILCLAMAIIILVGCSKSSAPSKKPSSDAPADKKTSDEVKGWDASEETDIIEYNKLEEKYGAIPKDAITEGMAFGAIMPEPANEYWTTVADGIQSKCDELGIKADIQFALNSEDQAGQLAAAETLAKKDYDAYIFSPLTEDVLSNVTEKLKGEGKPVINPYFTPMQDADVFVGALDAQIAEMAAKETIETLGGEGKAVTVMGAVASKLNQVRCKTYVDYIESNSNIEVVAELPAEWVAETAMQMTQDLLAKTPDIDLFWCANDNLALGVIEGVRSKDLIGKVKILSMDATASAVQAVKNGEMYGTYSSDPFLIGELSVEAALRKVAGQDIARVVSGPIALVDAANVDQFIK